MKFIDKLDFLLSLEQKEFINCEPVFRDTNYIDSLSNEFVSVDLAFMFQQIYLEDLFDFAVKINELTRAVNKLIKEK